MSFNLLQLKAIKVQSQRVLNLYHGTFGWNEKSILSEGIKANRPGYGNWVLSKPGYVYLASTAKQAAGWVRTKYTDYTFEWDPPASAVVFQVDMTKLDPRQLSPDTIDMEGLFQYHGDVPPDALQVVEHYDWTNELMVAKD